MQDDIDKTTEDKMNSLIDLLVSNDLSIVQRARDCVSELILGKKAQKEIRLIFGHLFIESNINFLVLLKKDGYLGYSFSEEVMSKKDKDHYGSNACTIYIDNLNKLCVLLEEIDQIIKKKTSGENVVSINLPPNTKFSDITIEFKNGCDVVISHKDKKIADTDFKQMGFYDKRTRNPNKQWGFLRALADNYGQIDWSSSVASDKNKKIKQRLSESLKKVFDLSEDPFEDYKENKAYRIKIKLIPS